MPLAAVFIFAALGLGLAVFAYLMYQRILRRAKGIERGLKMVPLLIHLPAASYDTAAEGRDMRQVFREKVSQAEVLYNLLAGTASQGFKSNFYGQRHISLEIIAKDGLTYFYAAVPVALVSVAQQAIVTAYPGAQIEQIEDYNIFSPEGRLAGTVGGELVLKTESAFPIATFERLERDPLEALLNTLSSLQSGEGAGVQILLRPAKSGWINRSLSLVKRRRGQHQSGLKLTALDLVKASVKVPEAPKDAPTMSNLELSVLEAIEQKTKRAGYEVLIRIVASSANYQRSEQVLRDIATAFALFDAPGLNGFKFLPAQDIEGLVTAFIFRFFPPELNSNILNSEELATLFHLPDAQFVPTAGVQRQSAKQVDGPAVVPAGGLLLGYNHFRGTKKEIRLSRDDRRRHSYIVGQTGTGKSTLLENMALQDMLAGQGLAFIDPHGDAAERLIGMIPKERAEDVIYFNAADTAYPLGLNLFEFSDPQQKDFLIQEAIAMLYKLYDPGHTGIIGPRYEHWFRNAALTLMSDPAGSTFIEIPKVFTDTAFLREKFKHVSDPMVVDFWTKEMAATSDYHKSEMLGWFVSKFGAFMSNEIMRNIIGQTKSAFNLREVMDQQKILIVNLSKGQIGELNSQLLGMIFVIKFQAAAMSRAGVDVSQRSDFGLYVDEFQNFSTDSFASILSEARKYGLNLIVANQFVGQLSDQIREAVFGNIGTTVSYRVGSEDAQTLERQFAPVFEARDLIGLPNYQAVVRLMINGLPSQPFSMTALPPLGRPHPEMAMAIKQLSAAKYGTERGRVEEAIYRRYQPTAPAVQPAPTTTPATKVAPEPTPAAAPAPTAPPKDGALTWEDLNKAAAKSAKAVPTTMDVAKTDHAPINLSQAPITPAPPEIEIIEPPQPPASAAKPEPAPVFKSAEEFKATPAPVAPPKFEQAQQAVNQLIQPQTHPEFGKTLDKGAQPVAAGKHPQLRSGEVIVDDDGNVIQG